MVMAWLSLSPDYLSGTGAWSGVCVISIGHHQLERRMVFGVEVLGPMHDGGGIRSVVVH